MRAQHPPFLAALSQHDALSVESSWHAAGRIAHGIAAAATAGKARSVADLDIRATGSDCVEITFEGMVVGDLLWLLVIAFLFVIITGMVG
jgi:hypothetical protein